MNQYDLKQYQTDALRTTSGGAEGPLALATFALGVAGEAGEVADLIKKHVGHGHPLDRAKVVKELGDVLWYVAVLAHQVDATLEEVAGANVAKLRARYPEGFSTAASLARVDDRGLCDCTGAPHAWEPGCPVWSKDGEVRP